LPISTKAKLFEGRDPLGIKGITGDDTQLLSFGINTATTTARQNNTRPPVRLFQHGRATRGYSRVECLLAWSEWFGQAGQLDSEIGDVNSAVAAGL
jgi:hypothetical protein